MKRILSLVLVLTAILSCAMPCSATEFDAKSTDNEIHLKYLEFYNNQAYYKNLARTQGYTLVISVGEEFEALETERIHESVRSNSDADDMENTEDIASPRGVNIPTRKWNVVDDGKYEIDGLSVQNTLYTQKKFCGATSYEVSIHNRYSKDSHIWFHCYTHGLSQDTNFAIEAGKTVIKYLTTSSTENNFYLEFSAPVNVDGYVMEYEEESA